MPDLLRRALVHFTPDSQFLAFPQTGPGLAHELLTCLMAIFSNTVIKAANHQ